MASEPFESPSDAASSADSTGNPRPNPQEVSPSEVPSMAPILIVGSVVGFFCLAACGGIVALTVMFLSSQTAVTPDSTVRSAPNPRPVEVIDIVPSYPAAEPVETLDQALSSIEEDRPYLQRKAAFEWLAASEVEPEQQPEVARQLQAELTGAFRKEALTALGTWATRDNAAALAEIAAGNNDTEARLAIQALGELRDPRTVSVLTSRLANPYLSKYAAESLRKIGGPAVEPLLPLACDGNPTTRKAVRELLAELKVQPERLAQQYLIDIRALDGTRRIHALEALAELPRVPELQAEFAERLQLLTLSRDSREVAASLAALANWGNASNVGMLLQLYEDASYRRHRKAVLQALAGIGEPSAFASLARGFENLRTCRDAQTALVAIGPPAESSVHPYLRHDSYFARRYACQVLGEIGTEKSVALLQSVAVRDSNLSVQSAAKQALADIYSRDVK